MEIENTFIEGLKIIHLNKISDNRGSFTKMFNEDIFRANNLRTDIMESYFSISEKNVIRGMHFQTPPAEHTKLVFVNKGSIVADDQLSTLQQQNKTSSVIVSFKEELEIEKLQSLNAAIAVKKIDANSWQLQSNDEESLRKQILSMAVENNLNIVSLQSGSNSLEDVFRSLTN